MHSRIRVVTIPATFKSVKNAVVLIEGAQPASEVIVDWVDLHRFGLHVDIPQLEEKGE